MLVWLFAEHHSGSPNGEFFLFVISLAKAVFTSGFLWVLYVALEPFVSHLMVFFPMTTELTAWYATNFTIALVICVALVVFGFYTSLAGQSLFGEKLLQD